MREPGLRMWGRVPSAANSTNEAVPFTVICITISRPSGETLGEYVRPATDRSLRWFEPSLSLTNKSFPAVNAMRPSGKYPAPVASMLARRRGSPAGRGIDHNGFVPELRVEPIANIAEPSEARPMIDGLGSLVSINELGPPVTETCAILQLPVKPSLK